MKLIAFILNWSLKLSVAWIMYLITTSLGAPEWAVMAAVAVGTSESQVSWEKNNAR